MAKKEASPFEAIDRELPRWLEEALASVVRWQWWEESPSPDPLGAARKRPPRPQPEPLDREPSDGMGDRRGFDAVGKPRVEQGMIGGKPSMGTAVWHHADGVVQVIHCTSSQPVRAHQVHTLRPSPDRPSMVVCEYLDERRWTHTYAYDDAGRIVRSDVVFESPFGKVHSTWSERVSYDAAGNATVTKVEKAPPAKSGKSSASGKGAKLATPPIAAMQERVEKKLVSAIQAAVKRAEIDGPAYCLVLAYDNENPGCLPPMLGIGLEREREAWIKAHGKEAADYDWNPAEFENYQTGELDLSEAVGAECEQLNQAFGESNAPAIRLLNRVAATLAKDAKWPKKFARTDDFIVFATDLECAQGAANRKKSVPPQILKRLKKRGL